MIPSPAPAIDAITSAAILATRTRCENLTSEINRYYEGLREPDHRCYTLFSSKEGRYINYCYECIDPAINQERTLKGKKPLKTLQDSEDDNDDEDTDNDDIEFIDHYGSGEFSDGMLCNTCNRPLMVRLNEYDIRYEYDHFSDYAEDEYGQLDELHNLSLLLEAMLDNDWEYDKVTPICDLAERFLRHLQADPPQLNSDPAEAHT